MPKIKGVSVRQAGSKGQSQVPESGYTVRPFQLRWHTGDSPALQSLFQRLAPPSAKNKVRCLRWKKNGISYLAMRMPDPPPDPRPAQAQGGTASSKERQEQIKNAYQTVMSNGKTSPAYVAAYTEALQKGGVLAAEKIRQQEVAKAVDLLLEAQVIENYKLPAEAEGLGPRTVMSVIMGVDRSTADKSLVQQSSFWKSVRPSLTNVPRSQNPRDSQKAAEANTGFVANYIIKKETGKSASEWYHEQMGELTGDTGSAAKVDR